MSKKECPKNYRWCPIEKKCVPNDEEKGKGKRQGRGQGKGPMGTPQKVQEAFDLLDAILVGDYQVYKTLQEMEDLLDEFLDEVENKIDNIPDQNLPELQQDVESDIGGTDSDEPEEAAADEKPQIENILLKTTKRLIKEEEFRTYFKGMMKKWKITSPTQLSDEKKKEFFSAVDKGWNAKKES